MMIVFCFVPGEIQEFREQIKRNRCDISIIDGHSTFNKFIYDWFAFQIQNNYVCVHQSQSLRTARDHYKNPQRICVGNKLINKLINKISGGNNINNYCIFLHHANGIGKQIGSLRDQHLRKFIIDLINSKDITINDLLRDINQNDPLILIFTPSGRANGEWEKSIEVAKKNKGNFYDKKLSLVKDWEDVIAIEFELGYNTIIFLKEDDYGKLLKKPLDNLLKTILSHDRWRTIPEKYVAIHDLPNYIENIDNFKYQVNYICDFHHDDKGPDLIFCNLLIKLLESIEENNNEMIIVTFNEIIDKIKELATRVVSKVSILKHRIMHLLGPIDNDLQGLWDEAVRNERTRFDEEKWKEVCEAYKDYNWKIILMDALEMIRESLEDLKKDLSENKQKQVQEFMDSINLAINYLNGAGDKNSTSDGFVKLIKEAKDLLDLIKIENIKKVYGALRKNKGANSIHKLFNELDKTFEGLI